MNWQSNSVVTTEPARDWLANVFISLLRRGVLSDMFPFLCSETLHIEQPMQRLSPSAGESQMEGQNETTILDSSGPGCSSVT